MKKILLITTCIFLFILPINFSNASNDFIYDLEPPHGNIGAICKDGTIVLITTSGACMLKGGRTFWIMPDQSKIPSDDYLNPFFIEPRYSRWKDCAWQTHPDWTFEQVDNCELKQNSQKQSAYNSSSVIYDPFPTTTIDYSQELEDAGLLYSSPTTTIPLLDLNNNKSNKEGFFMQNNHIVILVISILFFLFLSMVYIVESNKKEEKEEHRLKQDEHNRQLALLREEREYALKLRQLDLDEQLKLKESSLNEKKVLTEVKLEEHKVINLGEKKLDLDYDLKSKEIDFEKIKDERDFTATQLERERNHNLKVEELQSTKEVNSFNRLMSVTKEERDYLLRQRELDIKEGKDSDTFTDVIESGKDVKFHIKK